MFSTLVLAFAAVAAASPVQPRSHHESGPQLPLTHGAKELPSPGPGSALQYILLGHGIQNYTCESVGAEPKAKGALAALYDITPLHPANGNNPVDITSYNDLVAIALGTQQLPLNIDPNTHNRVAHTLGADAHTPFKHYADLALGEHAPIPQVGQHLFTSEGVPQFIVDTNLGAAGPINFLGKKLDGVPPPHFAAPGPSGTGAVDWLQLGQTTGSQGSSLVYRVVTAGGKLNGCSSAGEDTVSYAAQYWFYS